MQLKHFLMLLALAALWGGSFLFMRVAAPEFGAFALVFTRCAIACVCLMPLIFIKGLWRAIYAHKLHLLVVGTFNVAVPFVLLAYTTIMVSAGFTSILNAFTPIFAAAISFVWLNDKLSLGAIIGLILSLTGVFLLVLDKHNLSADVGILPILTGIGATLGYGFATNYSKLYLNKLPALATSFGSQLFATLVLTPLLIIYWPEQSISATAWINAIILGVFSTAFAFVMFYNLMQQIGVTRTVAVTYLIPIFAIGWGFLFLQETLTLEMALATLVILIGVALVNGVKLPWKINAKNLQKQ